MYYGPVSYFTLGRIHPRLRTREPFVGRRGRRATLTGLAASIPPTVEVIRRTVTLTSAVTLSAGDQLRVMALQLSGPAALRIAPDSSTFTVTT